MAKRSAEDAGLNEPQNEENNEEIEEQDDLEDEGAGSVGDEGEEGEEDFDNEGDDSSGSNSDASSDTPTPEYMRGFALSWLEDQRIDGLSPNAIFESLGMKVELLSTMPEAEQWSLIEKVITTERVTRAIFRTLFKPHRNKLPGINTFDDVVKLIQLCNNIVILTGAGVSVSCGIPDFRSPGGLYSVIEAKYNLPEPQCLFDIHYLRDDPHPFFEFAREIFPGQHKPSPTHYFIKELEQRGKLLRNYTQNIDTLERVAGIGANKLVNCHGSFATASCIKCKRQVDGDLIRSEIMSGTIPLCTPCNDDEAFMKPDIVFFGEALPDRFDECLKEDIDKIDLLLVMGSSLKVKPVAYVPEVIRPEVPQILINRELVAHPHEFDFANLGDCDAFVINVCKQLNWTLNGKSPEEYIIKPSSPIMPSLPSISSVSSSSSTTITTPDGTTTTTVTTASTSSSSSSYVSLSIPSITIPTNTSVTSPLASPSFSSPLPSLADPAFDMDNLDSLPAPGPINM